VEHIVNFSFAMMRASKNFSQESRSALLADCIANQTTNSTSALDNVYMLSGKAIDTSAAAPIAPNKINTLCKSSMTAAAAVEPGVTSRTDVSSD
jgi:hypothetical protein